MFSDGPPELVQLSGIVEKPDAPIDLDRHGARPLARHRDIRRLHGSPREAVLELIALDDRDCRSAVCCGSGSVSADDRIRRPVDPVSTRMPSIVWQLVVLPGTQIVTLVNTPLA